MKNKKFKWILLVLILLPCVLLFSACNQKPYVVSIEKSGSNELYTVYKITYSDDTVSSFTVENGKDGQDAPQITIADIYEEFKNQTGQTDISFEEFLKIYFSKTANETDEQTSLNRAMLSAVSIYTRAANSDNIYCGAGVIYKIESNFSYIITNYHVAYNEESATSISDEIKGYLYGYSPTFTNGALSGSALNLQFVGGSMQNDVAVLRCSTAALKALNPSARAVDVAEGYSVGDTAIAIGNPDGDGLSVTRGIVSVDSEYIQMPSVDNQSYIQLRVMRIDTAVNGGNSGGGLFTNDGALIGIVNAKKNYSSDEKPMDNYAYALPYNIVTKVADSILYYSSAPKKFVVGVSVLTENSRGVFKNDRYTLQEDVTIKEVTSNSFASQIGLAAEDVVKKVYINNTEYTITRRFDLFDLMYTIRPNDTVSFVVDRAGQQLTFIGTANEAGFTTVN